MAKPGLFIVPENTPPKFYIQHLYPYYLVRQKAADKTILDIGFGDATNINFPDEAFDIVCSF
jgi:hypothetical protein